MDSPEEDLQLFGINIRINSVPQIGDPPLGAERLAQLLCHLFKVDLFTLICIKIYKLLIIQA